MKNLFTPDSDRNHTFPAIESRNSCSSLALPANDPQRKFSWSPSRFVQLAALMILATVLSRDLMAASAELRITRAALGSGGLSVAWEGGRPAYQVQIRPDLDTPWQNLDDPTTGTAVTIPLGDDQAFVRIVGDYTARYEVVFDATWSQATHPQDWPASAHWSGLVGAVHNDQVAFFRAGETASEGIRRMAEFGQQDPLLGEVSPAIAAGAAHFQLRGGGIGSSPGSTRLVFPEPMRRDFPLVTLCSMIAPSPDWFVAVSGVSLLENGEWLPSRKVQLFPYDAGTDSGPTFASPDQVTVPRGVVTQLNTFPIAMNGTVTPFGTFTFKRLD